MLDSLLLRVNFDVARNIGQAQLTTRDGYRVKFHLRDERTKRHARLFVVSVRSVHPVRGTRRDAS